MVDLQRRIEAIWNIVLGEMQDGPRNSDGAPLLNSLFSEKFSAPDSGENFIRADLSQLEPAGAGASPFLTGSTYTLKFQQNTGPFCG